MTAGELLKIEGVSGGYHKEDIVKNVSFHAYAGEFLGIIGPNGSGKSTLLRLVTGIIAPSKGNVLLGGRSIKKIPPKELAKVIGFVSQDMPSDFSYAVWDIALMGRIPHLRRLQSETKRDIDAAVSALEMTDSLCIKHKRLDELSAGERQRVLIAKALAQEPSLLILDEPTSHLDIGHQAQIMNLLKKLNAEKGLTIIMVLHDLNLASEYCDRILLMDKGSVYREGNADEVLNYQTIEAVYGAVVLVNKNPVSGKPYVMPVPEESICERR